MLTAIKEIINPDVVLSITTGDKRLRNSIVLTCTNAMEDHPLMGRMH